jgi:subtilase family serine protease
MSTFRVFADSRLQVVELQEYNNQLVKTYVPKDHPDFIVTDITLSPTNPATGSKFIANVSVKNTGRVAGNAGYLDIWLDKSTDVIPGPKLRGDRNQYVGTLRVSMTKRMTFTGLLAGTNAVPKVFRAVVDSRANTIEVSETNNQSTVDYIVVPVL